MTLNTRLQTLTCSWTHELAHRPPFEAPPRLCSCCPAPGRPLRANYDLEAIGATGWVDPSQRGLWRYAPLLPVRPPTPDYAADVGGTALVSHPALSASTGHRVLLKNESTNPTWSFKDRGLAMGVALGVAAGAQRFALPTQGNAGVAAALFSRRAGLPGCLVYMPEGHRGSYYHRMAATFGAEIHFHGAQIAEAGKKMREDLAPSLADGTIVDLSTFFEPGRLEGKKTLGLEIFEACAEEGLPDVIFYPTGGGTGLVGIWKALEELEALGVYDPKTQVRPKMVAVQSEGCAPVVRAFDRGDRHVTSVVSQGTLADGLDVPGAIMGHDILRVLRESGGYAQAVSEAAIKDAHTRMGHFGIPVGYESAALLAALEKSSAEGRIPKASKVLLLLTGGPGPTLGR